MLKKLLNVSSFSEVVGMKQPAITCPMIDDEQNKLKVSNTELGEELSELEAQIGEEEESETPCKYTLASLQKRIDQLNSEINSNDFDINGLEKDRETVKYIRSQGESNRTFVLDLFDENLIEHNGKMYLFTKEIEAAKKTLNSGVVSKGLKTSYKSVEDNYNLLVDWAVTWAESIDLLWEKLPSSVIQIDIDKDSRDEFFVLMTKLEAQLKGESSLSQSDILAIIGVIPECAYSGNAYKCEGGYTVIRQGEDLPEFIKGLRLRHLWDKCCPELDIPEIDYLAIE